jgi:hypothetical protein
MRPPRPGTAVTPQAEQPNSRDHAPRPARESGAVARSEELHSDSEWRAHGPDGDCIQIVIDGGKANEARLGHGVGNSECRAEQPAVQLIRSDEKAFLRELHQIVLRASRIHPITV